MSVTIGIYVLESDDVTRRALLWQIRDVDPEVIWEILPPVAHLYALVSRTLQ